MCIRYATVHKKYSEHTTSVKVYMFGHPVGKVSTEIDLSVFDSESDGEYIPSTNPPSATSIDRTHALRTLLTTMMGESDFCQKYIHSFRHMLVLPF